MGKELRFADRSVVRLHTFAAALLVDPGGDVAWTRRADPGVKTLLLRKGWGSE